MSLVNFTITPTNQYQGSAVNIPPSALVSVKLYETNNLGVNQVQLAEIPINSFAPVSGQVDLPAGQHFLRASQVVNDGISNIESNLSPQIANIMVTAEEVLPATPSNPPSLTGVSQATS